MSNFIAREEHFSLSDSVHALDILAYPSPILTASDLSCSISSGEIPIFLFDNAYILEDKELPSGNLDASFSDAGFSPHTPFVESFDLSQVSPRPPLSTATALCSGGLRVNDPPLRQARLRSKSSPETTKNRAYHVSPRAQWQQGTDSPTLAAGSYLPDPPTIALAPPGLPVTTSGHPPRHSQLRDAAYNRFVQRLGIQIPGPDIDDLSDNSMPLSPTELAQQRRGQRRAPIQLDMGQYSSMASLAESSDTLLRALAEAPRDDEKCDTPMVNSSPRPEDYIEHHPSHRPRSPERERGRRSTREPGNTSSILYKSPSPDTRRAPPQEAFPWLTDLTIQLLIDQEGFRTAKPKLGFSSITTLKSTSNGKTTRVLKAQFRPLARQSFHFHHAPLESPPILRRVTLGNSDTHDYVSRQAHLTLKSNGVYVVQGYELSSTGNTGADGNEGRLEWRFEYLVDDRRRDPTRRVAEGDKIVTPISFSCSPELFLPQQGKRLNVMHVLKKGVAHKLTAEKLQPPSLPQPTPKAVGVGVGATAAAAAASSAQTLSVQDSPRTPSPAKQGGAFGFGLPEVSPKRLAWNIHRRVQSHHQGSQGQAPRDRGSNVLDVGSPPKESDEGGLASRRRGSFAREGMVDSYEEGLPTVREGLPICRPKQRMSFASSAPSPTRWGLSPPKSPLVSLGEDLVVSYLPTMMSTDLFGSKLRPRGSSKERSYGR